MFRQERHPQLYKGVRRYLRLVERPRCLEFNGIDFPDIGSSNPKWNSKLRKLQEGSWLTIQRVRER